MDQPAQPAVSVTSTAALREDLGQREDLGHEEDLGHGASLLRVGKPSRKKSSYERDGWWRINLTNTPIPGTYHLKTFLEEALLNPVITTYNFKNEGRRKPPLLQRNDPTLLDIPQYKPPDFIELLKKQVASYSFKDKPRPSPSTLVYKDKSLELSPGQYEVLPMPVSKQASRSFVFRSTVQRFPPNYFTPHEGPGPGEYNLKIPPTSSITSSFRSKVPRFLPSCSRTPGPGAYTASNQFPQQSPTIAKMGREHSLFFNNTIGL
ncbi:protein STPG4 [Perognathus longimembris pacificus]|uniref:protein STPG4 n=1 Tax=Perognathus longimembris pacificus TaxID=214514 RepID=UPI002018B9C3|nr:protein STPG4 [Perognathus longimembris pacificus]